MTLLSLAPTVGTQTDIVSRLKAVLPTGWFPDDTPVLDGVLNGVAAVWTALMQTLSYVQLQTRVATATDTFLDLVAQDFFGANLTRAMGEPDTSLRDRIQRNLLQPQATRGALSNVLQNLTGRTPRIFEPARLQDTGAYTVATTLAYNTLGGYGSASLPFQCFVNAFRPIGAGVANTNGYNIGIGGYGIGSAQYTTPTMAASTILDNDIYQAIAATMPVATTAWTAITN